MTYSRRLYQLLARAQARKEPLGHLFRDAEDEGFDLVQVVELIEVDTWEPTQYGRYATDEDLICALLAHLGDERRVVELLGHTRRHKAMDVNIHVKARDAERAFHDALVRDAPARALIDLLCQAPTTDDGWHARDALWKFVIAKHPVDRWLPDSRIPIDVLRRELVPRVPARQAAERLSEVMNDDEFIFTMGEIWDVQPPHGMRGRQAKLAIWAALAREAGQSLWSLLPITRAVGEPVEWLAVFRHYRFRASQAILYFIENDPRDFVWVADVLARVGYTDDEILDGFRDNALGVDRSLRVLQRHGWDIHRLTAAMQAGQLAPAEVREHLRALGVTESRLRELLADRYGSELVSLLLPGEGAHLAELSTE